MDQLSAASTVIGKVCVADAVLRKDNNGEDSTRSEIRSEKNEESEDPKSSLGNKHHFYKI